MATDIKIKICGLKSTAHVQAAVAAGAGYVGFVFFAKSPRNITQAAAALLAQQVPPGIAKVALSVNASDTELDAIVEAVPLDMLQLHGAETPDRVDAVRARYGLPVMKA
ncbi:MAG: N-(5'-phosphoribosyl)anthranilate isomerase, partial [Marinosulfonomonas sp.]|nr:N-(5'-phosphoribosyl)anthranilate isomerase [Marinosulfonomonas sp.]